MSRMNQVIVNLRRQKELFKDLAVIKKRTMMTMKTQRKSKKLMFLYSKEDLQKGEPFQLCQRTWLGSPMRCSIQEIKSQSG